MPCQPLKVMFAPRLLFSGTLKGDVVSLGAENIFSGTPKKDLVSISIRDCCLHIFQKIYRECLSHCFPGKGLVLDQRTTLGRPIVSFTTVP